jgi:uncharacterized membrane protein YkvA (DUF1232 family)
MTQEQDLQPKAPDSRYEALRTALSGALQNFGIAVWLVNFVLFPIDMLVMLQCVFRDPIFTVWLKLELILSLLYFIVPDDLIPDFLTGIGLIDDVLIFLRAAYYLFNAITREGEWVLEELWPGEKETIFAVDDFVVSYGRWATRLLILIGIYKIVIFLFAG